MGEQKTIGIKGLGGVGDTNLIFEGDPDADAGGIASIDKGIPTQAELFDDKTSDTVPIETREPNHPGSSNEKVTVRQIIKEDIPEIAVIQNNTVKAAMESIEEGDLPADGYFMWQAHKELGKAIDILESTLDMHRSVVMTSVRDGVEKVVGYLLIVPLDKVEEANYSSQEHMDEIVEKIDVEQPSVNNIANEAKSVVQVYVDETLRGTRLSYALDEKGGANETSVQAVVRGKEEKFQSRRTVNFLYTFFQHLNKTQSEKNNLTTLELLLGEISLLNPVSGVAHRRLGFKWCGFLPKIAKKLKEIRDIVVLDLRDFEDYK